MNNNKLKIYDYLSAVRIKNSDVNAMTAVKGGVWWVKVIVRLLGPIGLSVTGPRVHAIVIILRKINKICLTQGIKGLVIHLKACSVCLNQALAGHKIKDSGQLNCRISRTNNGIPRFILCHDRMRIRNGDIPLLKFYNSVFALYRVLDFEGKLDVSSIVKPFTGDLKGTVDLFQFIPPFIAALHIDKVFGVNLNWIKKNYGQFWEQFVPKMPALDWLREQYAGRLDLWIAKSSPGTHREGAQVSTHPVVMIRAAVTIVQSSIYPAFDAFLAILPPNHPFKRAFNACAKLVGVFKEIPSLGKIGIKEEAAGKVRLFAMVTAWYQMLLKPLHVMMFKILRAIPQDGTFDQLKPLNGHYMRYRMAFSLDLKTATDRLPLILQQAIVSALIGQTLADAWGRILVGIEYHLSSLKYDTNLMLKYAIGQPMGALSSWASLALTHHFLVQVSAWQSGEVPVGTWFTDYAVLGDDLVIFNQKVAKQYLKILKIIGMEVGLHKSILSRDHHNLTLEFAKRVFHKGEDISPVPILEFTAALFDYGRLLEFSRKYRLSPIEIAKLLGFRYRALAKLNSAKFTELNYKLRMLLVALQVPTTEEGALSLLELGAPPQPSVRIATEEILKTFTVNETRELMIKLDRVYQSQLSDTGPFWDLKGNILNLLGDKPATEKVAAEGWFGHIHPKLTVPVESTDGPRWTRIAEKRTIPGPAELKEISHGWVMFHEAKDDPIFQPSFLGPTPEIPVKVRREVNLNLLPKRLIVDALRHLLDLMVLPPRQDALDLITEVRTALLDPRSTAKTIAAALVKVIEHSREVALVPSVTGDLIRHSPTSYPKESISMKLWKRWTPVIQGSVSLSTFLETKTKKESS